MWEFPPTHKIWLAANHKPITRGTDTAIWRRPRLISFVVTFQGDQKDTTLPDKLKRELPGILRWAVEGCLDWQRRGLQEPLGVLAATESYRQEMDILGQFLRECCHVKMGEKAIKTKSSVLHKAFCTYSDTDWSTVQFSNAMTERGFTKRTSVGSVTGKVLG